MSAIHEFGAMIKEYRSGYKISDVAELTGMAIGYWSNIELGKKTITFEAMTRFCDAVGVKKKAKIELVEKFMKMRCEECKYRVSVDLFLKDNK